MVEGYLLKCFGNNDYGQIGYGDVEDRGNQVNELGDYLPFIDLGTGKLANSVFCGAYHTVFFHQSFLLTSIIQVSHYS